MAGNQPIDGCARLTDWLAQGMAVQFCRWFWIADNKVEKIQVACDPLTLLEMGRWGVRGSW